VAPNLAHDTAATIAEARGLHKAVDRPNLMVKVPATQAGIPAIRWRCASSPTRARRWARPSPRWQ
jgi:hypothetical protein